MIHEVAGDWGSYKVVTDAGEVERLTLEGWRLIAVLEGQDVMPMSEEAPPPPPDPNNYNYTQPSQSYMKNFAQDGSRAGDRRRRDRLTPS